MSQENVEIVRWLHEAFARGDNDTPFSVYDPEIEWDMTRLPLPGEESVYHGQTTTVCSAARPGATRCQQ
jgi:hypothetical protein